MLSNIQNGCPNTTYPQNCPLTQKKGNFDYNNCSKCWVNYCVDKTPCNQMLLLPVLDAYYHLQLFYQRIQFIGVHWGIPSFPSYLKPVSAARS
jgi:hypothetical protein